MQFFPFSSDFIVISNPFGHDFIFSFQNHLWEEQLNTPTSTSSFQNGLFSVREILEPRVIGHEYVGVLSASCPSSALVSVSMLH